MKASLTTVASTNAVNDTAKSEKPEMDAKDRTAPATPKYAPYVPALVNAPPRFCLFPSIKLTTLPARPPKEPLTPSDTKMASASSGRVGGGGGKGG